jgi:PqqD family protein of HPr-rel-A system
MTQTETWKPQLIDGLDLCEVVDGYVVYEAGNDKVHYLNNTAALVLELCTGDNSRADITAALRDAFKLPEAPDAEVGEILERFSSAGLIR